MNNGEYGLLIVSSFSIFIYEYVCLRLSNYIRNMAIFSSFNFFCSGFVHISHAILSMLCFWCCYKMPYIITALHYFFLCDWRVDSNMLWRNAICRLNMNITFYDFILFEYNICLTFCSSKLNRKFFFSYRLNCQWLIEIMICNIFKASSWRC